MPITICSGTLSGGIDPRRIPAGCCYAIEDAALTRVAIIIPSFFDSYNSLGSLAPGSNTVQGGSVPIPARPTPDWILKELLQPETKPNEALLTWPEARYRIVPSPLLTMGLGQMEGDGGGFFRHGFFFCWSSFARSNTNWD